MIKNNQPILKSISILLASVMLLNSCAIFGANKAINETNKNVNKANEQLATAKNLEQNNYIRDVNSIFVSDTVISNKKVNNLPDKFKNQIQLDKTFVSMRDFATTVRKLTQTNVLLDVSEDKVAPVRITQSKGNLIDMLDAFASETNTAWRYTDGKIVLSDTETELFAVKLLPGDIQIQNQVNSTTGISSSQGGGGSVIGGDGENTSGGGGQQATSTSNSTGQQNTVQNVQYNLSTKIWDNITGTTKNMLSPIGKMNGMPETSTIAITDRPAVLEKIAKYIKEQNELLNQQVQIDVQVLSVETNAEDNYGINWALAFKNATTKFNINGQGASGLAPIFSPSSTTQAFTLGILSGDFAGSQLVIDALSTITKTSLVTSTAVTTLSNQPAPIQVIKQQSYVSNIATTQVANAGAMQSINTGQINYGFTLNILPKIENTGLVRLQVSLNLSSLNALTSFAVTNAMVQLPDMTQRNIMQKVVMKDGDTYVVTGFDSDFNQVTNTGVGSPYFWFFGGGVTAKQTRTKLVVLITPRVVRM